MVEREDATYQVERLQAFLIIIYSIIYPAKEPYQDCGIIILDRAELIVQTKVLCVGLMLTGGQWV